MTKLDFKTEAGQAKTRELVNKIFSDFDNVETSFSESGYGVTVTVDDCIEFSFTDDNLLQTKRLLWLLSLQKLNRLTNGKRGECDENN